MVVEDAALVYRTRAQGRQCRCSSIQILKAAGYTVRKKRGVGFNVQELAKVTRTTAAGGLATCTPSSACETLLPWSTFAGFRFQIIDDLFCTTEESRGKIQPLAASPMHRVNIFIFINIARARIIVAYPCHHLAAQCFCSSGCHTVRPATAPHAQVT